jgi:hypothetical protein
MMKGEVQKVLEGMLIFQEEVDMTLWACMLHLRYINRLLMNCSKTMLGISDCKWEPGRVCTREISQ